MDVESERKLRVHICDYRVIYGDTDQMGIVYHGNYLRFFERGRVEFLRAAGVTHREIEARGFLIPVLDAQVKYRTPARYEDLLLIETRVVKMGRVKLVFEYRVLREDEGGTVVVATGTTIHGSLDRNLRPARIPAGFGERLMYEGAAPELPPL